jgi:hypothetical protein
VSFYRGGFVVLPRAGEGGVHEGKTPKSFAVLLERFFFGLLSRGVYPRS